MATASHKTSTAPPRPTVLSKRPPRQCAQATKQTRAKAPNSSEGSCLLLCMCVLYWVHSSAAFTRLRMAGRIQQRALAPTSLGKGSAFESASSHLSQLTIKWGWPHLASAQELTRRQPFCVGAPSRFEHTSHLPSGADSDLAPTLHPPLGHSIGDIQFKDYRL